MSKSFGYARVSSTDQDLMVQVEALKTAGVNDALIFAEKKSGTTTEGRAELERLLAILSDGDVLCVTRIDRLARSMHDFSRITHDLKKRGVGVRVLLQGIDTSVSGPVGELTMNLLASFAEFETAIRRERQMEGIARAKRRGVYKGGKRKVDPGDVRRLEADGLGASAIARQLGCGRATVYRALAASTS